MKKSVKILIIVSSICVSIFLSFCFIYNYVSVDSTSIVVNTDYEEVEKRMVDIPHSIDMIPVMEDYKYNNLKLAYKAEKYKSGYKYESVTIHMEFDEEYYTKAKIMFSDNYYFMCEPEICDSASNRYKFPYTYGIFNEYNFYLAYNMSLNSKSAVLYENKDSTVYNNEFDSSINSFAVVCFNDEKCKINFIYIYDYYSSYSFERGRMYRANKETEIGVIFAKVFWYE